MMWQRGAALTGLLFISACKIDSQYEVFLSDVVEFAENPQAATFVNSSFRVEMPSSTDCLNNMDKLLRILSSYYHDISQAKCTTDKMEDFLVFAAKSPLLPYADGRPQFPDGIVAGLAVNREQNGEVVLYAVIDKARQRTLTSELASAFSNSSVDIQINSIVVDLNNDSKVSYLLRGPSMFVNDEPMIWYSATVSRREKVVLALSDVARMKISKDGSWPIIAITEAKQ